jgi:hypothetical protein
MNFLRSVTFLLLLGSAAIPLLPPAEATSFYPRSFPETVQDAPVIVRGKIQSSYSDWGVDSDGNKRLYTYYDLQLEEVFKGEVKGRTLLFRELGGEKDGIGMDVAGAAHFEKGEDVVVTLGEKNPDTSYNLRGLMTGKFNVRRDESDKEYLLASAPDEHPGAGPTNTKWTLEALRSLVAEQARSASPRAAQPQGLSSSAPAPSVSLTPVSAPQLQTAPAQGASLTPMADSGNSPQGGSAIYWVIGILLAGGVGIWAAMRGKK